MKNIILAAVASIALPFSVTAGELLPNLYAKVYCESRSFGMTADEARTQAVSESYIRTSDGMPVTIKGVKTTTDVVASVRATYARCPQYF